MRILKFIVKSFFSGCFGCLGALSLLAVVILIVGLIFGPSLTGSLSSFLNSIPSALMGGQNQTPFDNNNPGNTTNNNNGNFQPAPPMEPYMGPPMEVFLTHGDDPNGQHLATFSSKDSQQVYFWVRSSETNPVNFELLITLPDKSQTQFGPIFTTDPSGSPVNCGQFGSDKPPAGAYRLEAIPVGSSSAAGLIEFVITE